MTLSIQGRSDDDAGQASWEEMRTLARPDLFHVLDGAGGVPTSYAVHVSLHSFNGGNHRYEGTVQFRPLQSRDHPKGTKIPTKVVWDVPVEAAEAPCETAPPARDSPHRPPTEYLQIN